MESNRCDSKEDTKHGAERGVHHYNTFVNERSMPSSSHWFIQSFEDSRERAVADGLDTGKGNGNMGHHSATYAVAMKENVMLGNTLLHNMLDDRDACRGQQDAFETGTREPSFVRSIAVVGQPVDAPTPR
jgi:hypothetical protein